MSLILFAGGDGTARDILDVVGSDFPILGIPAGVKMQSAVFAVSPEAAGRLAALLAADRDGKIAFREAEVMDIDEEGLRAGRVSARLYGYARVPVERHLMQNPKAGGSAEDATLDALCREIAEEMAPGLLYVIGPGTTTQRVLHHLGLEGACWASMRFSTASSSGATSPAPSSRAGAKGGRPESSSASSAARATASGAAISRSARK